MELQEKVLFILAFSYDKGLGNCTLGDVDFVKVNFFKLRLNAGMIL